MPETAIDDMLAEGMLKPVSADELDAFLEGDGLRVLFFSGTKAHRREAHDVAVALREFIKDYGEAFRARVIATEDEAALHPRFRVQILPSLVFILGGEALEVVPGVKDWAVYTAAFQRYLGPARAVRGAQSHSPREGAS